MVPHTVHCPLSLTATPGYKCNVATMRFSLHTRTKLHARTKLHTRTKLTHPQTKLGFLPPLLVIQGLP